jgi:DNA-binding beta-propeller fold protein YncE
MISVNGTPFDVSVLGDTSFVSLGSSIDVFSDRSFAPVLRHTVSLAPRVAGLALTPDGHHLLAATDSGAVVLDTAALESGSSGAVVGSLAAPSGGGGIEVSVSPDGHFAFVTLEGSADLAVFDLQAALSAGFGTSHFVGTVPLQEAPVGMAISPDGRYLYATSEAAGVGPRQQGTLSVISLSRAEVDPAHSVLAIVTAGCQAVRVVTTGNGSVVWVTARASDPLLGFSAAKLLSDPAHALVATVAVGEAPVGLAVLRSGNLIVVANSNRFGTQGATASLSVVNVTTALAGGPAVVGEITAGHFPRQFASEPNGRTLLVTNYDSGQLEAVDVSALPI